MKICVFGADGRTGVEVVNCAKQKGFDVLGFVYNAKAREYLPQDIELKIGDIMDYEAVKGAVLGSDAVISVVGHIAGSDPLMQTKGIVNVVKAMQETGIKRIISLTGTGARENYDCPSFIDKFLNFFVKLIDPNRINDGIEHVKVLKQSNLDWTVVRVLKLSKSNSQKLDYKLNIGGPAELQTSRKKVAKILVDQINNQEYIKKLPVVTA